ncbi:MAG: hypothetical protein KJZ59_07665, partial [Pararhodobacter sp.]|nr:hypothetical protein [Pararhodobacter sp.]
MILLSRHHAARRLASGARAPLRSGVGRRTGRPGDNRMLHILFGVFGLACLIGLAFLFSSNR